MAVDRIEVWLRIRDRARFARDAARTAHEIRQIDKAARDAGGGAEELGGALGYLAKNGATVAGRTRIFGFAVGTVLTVLVALIPVVVGLGGALVALTGSLASAAVGAALLAGAFGGVLAISLGLLGLAVFNFMKNFAQVNERFNTWRNAVESFGRGSTQAQTAFARLQGVIANSGGAAVYKAVYAFYRLRNAFTDAMAPATAKLMGFFSRLFESLEKYMPTLARLVGWITNAVIPVFEKWGKLLLGGPIQSRLALIVLAFQKLAGPVGQGVSNVFSGIIRLITRMLPDLGGVSDGFLSITESFLKWTNSGDLKPFVNSARDWWNLLKAIGGLLLTVLGGGAKEGDSLVVALTGVLNRWNEILKAPGGRKGMISFFQDSITFTKALVKFISSVIGALFRFGRALLPTYTKVFNALVHIGKEFIDAFKPAAPFFENVLLPILKGVAKGVIGGLVGAFKVIIFTIRILATVLGFIGSKLGWAKGIFEVVGQIIGFVFGGFILRAISALSKISILFGPLGWAARMLAKPIELVGRAFGFVFGWGVRLAGWIGGFAGRTIPMLASAWNKILGFISGLSPRFWNAGAALWRALSKGLRNAIGSGLGFAGDIGKSVWNFVAGQFNRALPDRIGPINLPDNPLPMLASGGVVSGSGSWISGEDGPELNTMLNGRVTVQPLPAVAAQDTSAVLSVDGGGKRVIISKIYLKGRQIAEAVADEAEDEAARW